MKKIINQIIKATDMEGGTTLREFWRSYNIWSAINIIGDSWAVIKESTMKGHWKQLCPQIMIL